MNITDDDRKYLEDFFGHIMDYTKYNKLLSIDNITQFKVSLETYINEFNMIDNEAFNLFLNDIRHEESMYKLNKYKMKYYLEQFEDGEIIPISYVVREWYIKSFDESYYEGLDRNDKKLIKKLAKKR